MPNLSVRVRRISPSHQTLAFLLTLAAVLVLTPVPSNGAGIVTNCTSFGPGPGTLGTALNGGGSVTFACSGTIIMPAYGIYTDTAVNATGQAVTLSGNHSNAMFYVQNARLDLVNLTLTAGMSDNGGISATSATVTLTKSKVIGNVARYGGGGIAAFSSNLTLVDSIVSGNSAGPGGGIGMFVNSSGTLIRTTVSGNSAFSGAGIETRASQLTLIESTVSGNSANSHAGGLQVDNASAVLINTTVSGNSAPMGGALAVDTSTVTLTNSTVTANMSQESGAVVTYAPSGTLTLKNTIVAKQVQGGDCSGPILSKGYNLDSDGSCGLTATGDLQSRDPHLGPLQDNGGPTNTHALLAGSPAIDHADPTSFPLTDQRGIARPQGGGPDIGAYEYAPQGAAIPTLDEWPLIALSTLVVFIGMTRICRQA